MNRRQRTIRDPEFIPAVCVPMIPLQEVGTEALGGRNFFKYTMKADSPSEKRAIIENAPQFELFMNIWRSLLNQQRGKLFAASRYFHALFHPPAQVFSHVK